GEVEIHTVRGDEAVERLPQSGYFEHQFLLPTGRRRRTLSTSPASPSGNTNRTMSRMMPRTVGQYCVYSVISRSSRMIAAAPTAGPRKEWIPPRIDMIRTSDDWVHQAISGKTLRLWSAYKPPAIPEKPPEMTNAMSWIRLTFTPTNSAL